MADPSWAPLLQYGALGAIAVALFAFARTAYKRETERADRLETELARLNTLLQERHIPALLNANQALHDATEALQAVQRRERR